MKSRTIRGSVRKRRCIAQICKSIVGKISVEAGEVDALIFTGPKVKYMLNAGKEEGINLYVTPCNWEVLNVVHTTL